MVSKLNSLFRGKREEREEREKLADGAGKLKLFKIEILRMNKD